MGKGVCGAAAERKETVLVRDVDDFPGHIACDGDSKSEIVVPILKNGKVSGLPSLLFHPQDVVEMEEHETTDWKGCSVLA